MFMLKLAFELGARARCALRRGGGSDACSAAPPAVLASRCQPARALRCTSSESEYIFDTVRLNTRCALDGLGCVVRAIQWADACRVKAMETYDGDVDDKIDDRPHEREQSGLQRHCGSIKHQTTATTDTGESPEPELTHEWLSC